ncbi:MAG TPA: hypothetical protein EYP32_00810 [Aquificaceae bacterium]|nr:hypothetical protein [Aquificaceae bacterium]
MKILFRVFLGTVIGIVIISTLLFLTFPKFIFADKLLERKGFFLITKGVKEYPFSIILEKGEIYGKNGRLIYFDKAVVTFSLKGLSLKIFCRGKSLEAYAGYFGKVELKFNGFSCLERVKLLKGKLTLGEGIFGRLEIEGLNFRKVPLDKLSLDFKGRTFLGKISYMGFELQGSGIVEMNRKDLMDSKVDGELSSKAIKVKAQGTLRKLRITVR